jgi:peptidyl-prolyl cis-trans isomerase D
VLESLVQREVLSQHASEQGYRVSDEALRDWIASIPAFQVDGAFSQQAYNAWLTGQGLSAPLFEAEQREALRLDQLTGGILESSFYTPAEFRRFIELAEQQREVAHVVFRSDDFVDQVEVTDEEVRAFYEANTERFMTPESVDIEYVELDLQAVAENVEISEEDLRAYYEDNERLYVKPEQRRARHILISVDEGDDEAEALATAESVVERLEAGESFEELAAELSDDAGTAQQGGDLGYAERGMFVGPFEEALFSMEVGEVRGPVQTAFGFHIIRLEDIAEGEVRPFEEVRDEIESELAVRRAEDRFIDRANALADAAFETPDDLGSIADSQGLEVQRLEGLERGPSPAFAGSPEVAEAAFSDPVLEQGQVSPLIEVSEERVVILRTAEFNPSAQQPLEAVSDEIRETLVRQQAQALAAERGGELVEAIETGAAPAEAAAEVGAEWPEAPVWVGRRSPEVPAGVLQAAFDAPRPSEGGAHVGGVSLPGGDYAVYRLSGIRAGDPATIAREQRDQAKERLARQSGQQELSAYVADLRGDASVELAPGILEPAE